MMRLWIAMFVGVVAVALGCGGEQAADPPKKPAKTDGSAVKTVEKTETKTTEVAKKEHDHSGWWCDEHGVPEAECSVCQGTVFKKLKPDEICKNHPDRAKAQCFICNPDLRAKYAAVYRAKYDKDPPEPEGNMPEKK
jgi:hypothetical protein